MEILYVYEEFLYEQILLSLRRVLLRNLIKYSKLTWNQEKYLLIPNEKLEYLLSLPSYFLQILMSQYENIWRQIQILLSLEQARIRGLISKSLPSYPSFHEMHSFEMVQKMQ